MSNEQPTWVWEVRWSNPHRPRPDGFAEVVLRVDRLWVKGRSAGPQPQEILEAWEEMHAYGYGVVLSVQMPPARQLPLESKQRIRRRNLWKRLLAKMPMFCADMYEEAIKAKPSYYGDYIAGEFADVAFARSTMQGLKMVKA